MTKIGPKTIEKLEGKIEDAIAEIMAKMGVRKLPLLPSQQAMHLTAKAAVAVYEAAVENDDRGRPAKEPDDGQSPHLCLRQNYGTSSVSRGLFSLSVSLAPK